MALPENKKITWCGCKWQTCMEGNRPIHPDYPWYYIDGSQVKTLNNEVHLSIAHKPTSFLWWNSGWKEKVEYNPVIASGLIKSVKAFPVNSSFECDVMMPEGNNLWFSFWLTACDDWPPEIDIFEGYTDHNGSYHDKLGLHWRFPFIYRNVRVESNVHYNDALDLHRQIGAEGVHEKRLHLPLCSQWNHFKCCWKEDFITFSINDVVVRTVTNKKVLSKMKTSGMWVIFNVWPNDKFDLSENGDVKKFKRAFIIKNFKVKKI